MGFGGFFMHSRTGLETEYLGGEWFDCIRACAEKAKELLAWRLGFMTRIVGRRDFAAGEVTRERKNRLRFFSLYESDREALACREVAGIICRYAVKLEKDERQRQARRFLSRFGQSGGKIGVSLCGFR